MNSDSSLKSALTGPGCRKRTAKLLRSKRPLACLAAGRCPTMGFTTRTAPNMVFTLIPLRSVSSLCWVRNCGRNWKLSKYCYALAHARTQSENKKFSWKLFCYIYIFFNKIRWIVRWCVNVQLLVSLFFFLSLCLSHTEVPQTSQILPFIPSTWFFSPL